MQALPGSDGRAPAAQGWRKSMEDAHIATTQLVSSSAPCSAMFGVFDGHGGRCAFLRLPPAGPAAAVAAVQDFPPGP